MNDRAPNADEQEDAAFRARLAPLAREVLPRPSAKVTAIVPTTPPSWAIAVPRRRPVGRIIMLLGLALFAVSCLAAAVALFAWNDTEKPVTAPRAKVTQTTEPPEAISEPSSELSRELIGLLMRRGNDAVADGDIMAARMLFERAAGMGSAAAANAAGNTYDSDFLAKSGTRGIRPDEEAALTWFHKAAAMGDPDERARLARPDSARRP